MTIKTARSLDSVRRTCGMPGGNICRITMEGDDVLGWTFEVSETPPIDSTEGLLAILVKAVSSGRHFFTPEDCTSLFFLAVDALDGIDDKSVLWRLYDAVLVGAWTGCTCQTGMLIEA